MHRLHSCFKFGWPLVAGLIAVSLGLAVFAGLAIEVVEKNAIGFDAAILNGLFNAASPTLTRLMEGITTTATPYVLGPLFLILAAIWWRTRRADIIALAASILGSTLLNLFVKGLFERARPSLHPALAHATGFSFPSGHSTAALAFYGMLAYLLARHAAPRQRNWIYLVGAVWILLVGLSRNYLEVHYPSDVLAAFALTLPWVLAVIFVHQCYAPRVPGEEKVIEPGGKPGGVF